MPLADLLAPEAIFPMLRASSKKQALQELAHHASVLMGRDQREIFETLLPVSYTHLTLPTNREV